MQLDSIGVLSFLWAGTLFGLFGLLLINPWRKGNVHWSLVFLAFASSFWLLMIAFAFPGFGRQSTLLLVLETIRYGALITAPIAALQFSLGVTLPKGPVRIFHTIWIGLAICYALLWLYDFRMGSNKLLLIWNGIILSVMGLMSVEQLYRHQHINRLLKTICVVIAASLVYDIYFYGNSLLLRQIDMQQWVARGAINAAGALTALGGAILFARKASSRNRISLSRPVAFYTTSLTIAGSLLAIMALGGYYVRIYGGNWGGIIQTIAIFAALTTVIVLFISTTIRARIAVLVDKHFFRHKFDYRTEWLKVVKYLSSSHPDLNVMETGITAVNDVFKGRGGILWLQDRDMFVPSCVIDAQLDKDKCVIPVDSDFCRVLREEEWVFSIDAAEDSTLGTHNMLMPEVIRSIPRIWLVLPLLTESKLVGFIGLITPTNEDAELTWEDLDLLKSVGREVAAYLERHQAGEALAQAKQFETFNKLTAFVMHDLKNLIAQQRLVVTNAAKHKDKPEFVDDAIDTIDNSVGRMENLLRKLQQSEQTSTVEFLRLSSIVSEACNRCKNNKPIPELSIFAEDFFIRADRDQATMVFVHMIKNAQEACKRDGSVKVVLRAEDNDAIITIQDNGMGMNEDFILNRLFKPFDSTKTGKGMGIGVYQSREFVQSLGGTIEVESTVGVGSTFTISLPSNHKLDTDNE